MCRWWHCGRFVAVGVGEIQGYCFPTLGILPSPLVGFFGGLDQASLNAASLAASRRLRSAEVWDIGQLRPTVYRRGGDRTIGQRRHFLLGLQRTLGFFGGYCVPTNLSFSSPKTENPLARWYNAMSCLN